MVDQFNSSLVSELVNATANRVLALLRYSALREAEHRAKWWKRVAAAGLTGSLMWEIVSLESAVVPDCFLPVPMVCFVVLLPTGSPIVVSLGWLYRLHCFLLRHPMLFLHIGHIRTWFFSEVHEWSTTTIIKKNIDNQQLDNYIISVGHTHSHGLPSLLIVGNSLAMPWMQHQPPWAKAQPLPFQRRRPCAAGSGGVGLAGSSAPWKLLTWGAQVSGALPAPHIGICASAYKPEKLFV